MTYRNLLTAIAFGLMSLAAAPAAFADQDPVYTGRFSNVAVQGYDTVAYFQDGEPQRGSNDFATEYMGATWKFASQENLDAFLADPDAYAPQYGGYCAWAIAQGKTAKGDARQWHITDGKLYLNINSNIKSKWLAERDEFIVQGDENWPSVLD